MAVVVTVVAVVVTVVAVVTANWIEAVCKVV